MQTTDATRLEGAPPREPASGGADPAEWRARRARFIWAAAGSIFVVTAVLWVQGLVRNDGHFLYVFDDTAIHMSIVRQVLHHGTWGVAAGHYASASSSPGWTLLLAAFTGVLPFAANALPLVLNLAAAAWLVWLFAAHQEFLLPRKRDWLAVLAIFVMTVVLWFGPGLALVGMEHMLHAALVVQLLVLLRQLQRRELTVRSSRLLLCVLFLAALVRYESAFLAVGIACALLLGTTRQLGSSDSIAHWTRSRAAKLSAAVLVVAAMPIVAFGILNEAFGESFLPNSIEAKTTLQYESGIRILRGPVKLWPIITSDWAVTAVAVLIVVYLVVAFRGTKRDSVGISIAWLVTALLHVQFASFGWYSRYEAYLLIAGSYVLLCIASEVVRVEWRTAVLLLAIVLIPVMSIGRINNTLDAPLASSNTYRQRYQMAEFLKRYYNHKAFLTGELGYSTLLHDGDVVDVLGLGTHEVLAQRKAHGPELSAAFVERLAAAHHVAVAAVYAFNPSFVVPHSWVLVGEWDLHEHLVSVPDSALQFYAMNQAGVAQLDRDLHAFSSRLPSHVKVLYRSDLALRYAQHGAAWQRANRKQHH
jgi:hypothetical protein